MVGATRTTAVALATLMLRLEDWLSCRIVMRDELDRLAVEP
jgi:hypothetical protein